MGIAEVQRKFSAYSSGRLPEIELRNCIKSALNEDPQLYPIFVELAEVYRRANLIDAGLQSTINADIAEVTGPRLELTRVRPARSDRSNTDRLVDDRAGNFSGANVSPGIMGSSPPTLARPGVRDVGWSHLPVIEGKSQPKFSADNDSNWGAAAHAANRSAPIATGAPVSTGSTSGSAWDTDERLAEVAAPLYPGSVLRDRFVLVEELGRGGMGVVYKAFDRTRGDSRDRYVAIKVLNEEFKRHPLAVRALQREARKAQKLAHPNVVTVYDCDRDGGNVYMVMEFLSGRSLDQVIRDDGSVGIPIVPAMEIVKSLGAALSYAHEQDIVHSDFKPSNAFLTQDGKVKVLDFGIARAAPSLIEKGERTLFDAGQLGAISPAYASLEMLRGEEPDVRDDVYAFACVTYELLTGSHPYQRIDALKAYETGLEPRPIRKLSRAQWRVLQQGLAFQRADRCHSVDSLVSQFLVKRSRAKVWIASTAIAVIAIALVGALAWRWDVQRLATLQRGLASSDSTRFSAALAQLSSAPYLLRAQILADDQSRTDLISRVQKEMQLAAARPAYDYTRARALSNQLKGVLPDPQPALQLDRQLDLGLQAELARLITDRDSTLSNSVMIPVQGDPNVTEVLERIRKLDPDNKALREPIIGSTYAEAAAEALHKGKPLLAADITAAGLGVAPEDPMLLQLQRQLETQETASKSQHVQSRSADDSRRELAAVFSNPEANQPWAEKAQEVIKRLAAVVPVSDPDLEKANQVVVSTFVTAAATARGQKRFDEAAALLGIARSFNQQAPEIVAESAALERDRALKSDPVIGEEKRAANEMLEEKFENQAAAGDIAGASATASALGRALGPSTYVARDVPRILISSYVHFAKSEFAAGQVDAALKTLAEGRRKFGKSAELKDLEVRFIAVADVYDRLSTAVALNVADMQHSLEALRASEGEEYETAAQMLAQVLADRIADQRAANRATVADRLLDTGRQIFSNYTELLGRGTAGHLSTTPIIVEDQ